GSCGLRGWRSSCGRSARTPDVQAIHGSTKPIPRKSPMKRSHSMLTLLAAVAAAMFSIGCGPEYPSCDTDGDCHDGEFCVNGQCQQCREDADCGAGQACNGGRCDDIPGYCSANTDCPAGQTCVNNACVAPEGYCATDADCPDGRECVDNVCVESAESASSCSLGTIYFPFDSSDLSTQARDQLVDSKACISRRN